MRIHPLAAIWAVAILLVIAIVLTACDRPCPATWQEIIITRMTDAHQRYQAPSSPAMKPTWSA